MTDPTLPVRSAPPTDDATTGVDVWGVLLAAGTSSRYGDENKLLRTVDGEPMVRRSARTLLGADLAGCVAVVGHDATSVRSALDGLPIDCVENASYEAGQGTSVRAGVRYAAARGADAVLVALGDMPFVSTESVAALAGGYAAGYGTALAAAVDGRRGNPVLFDATHFDALASLDEDVGGRSILLDATDAALIETGDPGVRRDVDVPDDVSDGAGE